MKFSDFRASQQTPRLFQHSLKESSVILEAKEDSLLHNIISYLQKKLGVKLVKVPGTEHFSNSNETGFGIRYIINGTTKCIRFNWHSKSSVGKATAIASVDYYGGKHADPDFNIVTQKISLAKSLPMLAKILLRPVVGVFKVFPENEKLALTESVEEILVEAKKDDFTAEECVKDFINTLNSGGSFTRSEFNGRYHNVNLGIFDTVKSQFGDYFEISGAGRVTSLIPGKGSITDLTHNILTKAGVLRVTVGGTKEEQLRTDAEEALEDEEEHIPFVDTLEHLEGLTKAVISGAGNALLVAGRGGVGKTQTVEDTLEKLGLQDGAGYFKMTGSASAIGIYTTLYQHRHGGCVLFDDCDGALGDQDARNIIKAATDTKKKRKLAWGKKSSFIFDPDIEDPETYEDDPSMVPKYFDFTGRIIFISNLSLNKLDPDGALRTRAFIINVNPTDEEVIDYMEKILHKIPLEDGLSLTKEERIEVFHEVKNANRKHGVSIRKLVRALNIAATKVQNWRTLVRLYS